MKLTFLFLSLFFQDDSINYQTIQHSEAYEFKVNYWFNMHHFLKHEAFLQAELDSSFIDMSFSNGVPKYDLSLAIDFYKEKLGDKDLRTDDYMSAFKIWVTELENNPESVPKEFREHFEVLRAFSKTYQQYFWPKHEESCLNVLDKYLPVVISTENSYWEEILEATRAFILDDTIKVDVVYVSKADKWNTRNRPYTSIFPTRVVMNSLDFDEVEGEWMELLFHESAHALILSRTGFVAGTIMDVAEKMKVKVPRQLGHAYLFYMTGHFTQQILKKEGFEYPFTYMQNKRVFSRYYSSLTKLDNYLNGKQTLAETTSEILAELTKN